MNQNLIEVIGLKQIPRDSALQINLNNNKVLENLLNKKFEFWSNFDGWGNIRMQRLIFEKALAVNKGKKLDICCNCCDFAHSLDNKFTNIFDESCHGLKVKFIINKLLDEIARAEEKRNNDGTYAT